MSLGTLWQHSIYPVQMTEGGYTNFWSSCQSSLAAVADEIMMKSHYHHHVQSQVSYIFEVFTMHNKVIQQSTWVIMGTHKNTKAAFTLSKCNLSQSLAKLCAVSRYLLTSQTPNTSSRERWSGGNKNQEIESCWNGHCVYQPRYFLIFLQVCYG